MIPARLDHHRIEEILDRLRDLPADPMPLVREALAVWDDAMARHASGEARLSVAEIRRNLDLLNQVHEVSRVALGAPPSSTAIH